MARVQPQAGAALTVGPLSVRTGVRTVGNLRASIAVPATALRSSSLRRALLGCGAAVVAAVGLVSASGFEPVVEILADDVRHEVRLSDGTVADALAAADVGLGPNDLVTPGPDTLVDQDLQVVVTRAITVDIVIDDAPPITVTAPVASVGGALSAADLGHLGMDGAVISPTWRAPVWDGDTITVRRPVEVVVEVDGTSRTLVSLAAAVADLLRVHDVELGPDDLVSPPPTARVGSGRTIVVQRVRFAEASEEVVLPHDEIRRETDELERGSSRVAQEGRDGVRVDRYRTRFVDGAPTGREILSREVVSEPVDRIVLEGTAAPPTPPTPPSPPSRAPTASGGSTSPSSSTSTAASGSSDVPSLNDPVWDRLAGCESNGNWQMNSGNGLYGGLQFKLETWRGVGGQGMPHEASREEQIRRAQLLLAPDAWWATFDHQFPHCSRILGLS
jgi:resuscitation-promoting factor RpfB